MGYSKKREEFISTDTPEQIAVCLSCEVPPEECKGVCHNVEQRRYQARLETLARIMFYGGTMQYAAHILQISSYQVQRYMRTKRFEIAMDKLRKEDTHG